MNRRWPLAAAAIAVGAVVGTRYRSSLERAWHDVRTFSAPSARIYDAVASPVLDGFFTRVALELVEGRSAPRVLEIGSGPGRLASRIAEMGRDATVVGSDVSPDMIDRAMSWAAAAGVGSRVSFVLGDASALPFADASFDAVVSTLSLHHWPDAQKGLIDVRRVLRPGGIARIYDIADWISRAEPGGNTVRGDELFRDGWTRRIVTRVGPVPLLYRADLAL